MIGFKIAYMYYCLTRKCGSAFSSFTWMPGLARRIAALTSANCAAKASRKVSEKVSNEVDTRLEVTTKERRRSKKRSYDWTSQNSYLVIAGSLGAVGNRDRA